MSRLRIPYGTDVVVDFPLVTAGSQAFKAPATSAAGDVKVLHDRLISTTTSGQTVAFTSGGTYEIRPGDTVTGATSAKTAVVLGVRLTSGTFAGGDAAGTLFLRSPSGAFQSENLDVGANTNVATIGGDLAAAGLFTHTALGLHAIGLPGTQSLGRQGALVFHDASGAEWEDSTLLFETYGHEAAFDPQGCVWTDAVGTATGQTTTNIRLSGAPSAPASAPKVGFYFEIVSGTGAGQAGYVKTYSSGATTDVVPYVALDAALDATSTVKFYRAAKRAPAHIVATEDIDLSATQKASVNAEADTAFADGLDLADGVESGLTPKNALRLIAAVLAGTVTSGGTVAPAFGSADVSAGVIQGTTARVTGAAVDADGNRGGAAVDFT